MPVSAFAICRLHVYCHACFQVVWRTATVVYAQTARSPGQWRRAIEALEARAPPDGVATLVNSLQNRVKSITLCVILNAKNGK